MNELESRVVELERRFTALESALQRAAEGLPEMVSALERSTEQNVRLSSDIQKILEGYKITKGVKNGNRDR